MRIAEVRVYTFDELTEKAKQRAIDKARQFLAETFDADPLTEMFSEKLEALGLPAKDIRWNLSFNQGDGVGFYGRVDIRKYAAIHGLVIPEPVETQDYVAEFVDSFTFTIHSRDHRYHHENTGKVEVEAGGGYPPEWDLIADRFQEHIQQMYHDTSVELANLGHEEILYQSAEPQVIDFLKDNGYEFTADGEVF